MDQNLFRSKVMGCFLGKNIGGTLGMPMEWERSKNNVTYYTHDITGEPLPNDDLDIQVLWLLALEEHGFSIDSSILGEYFNEYMIFTHAEYGTAKTNLRAGLKPPVSGSFHNSFKDSCGSYIRADIWACLFPGHPELAARYAFEDAIVDHGDGEGVFAEVFIAAMESAAFYCTDIRQLIDIGLSYIPDQCAVSLAVKDAIRTFDEGMSIEDSREFIMKNYIGHLEWHAISKEDEEKGYQNGKMGWDVPSNLMIIIYGLLFGAGDVEKSMCIAVNYGEDTDCTAGTIAALFGIMYGDQVFSEKWITPIGRKIVTVSINPFLMYGKIPKTVDEMADRVISQKDLADSYWQLQEWNGESFYAPSYFQNLYQEMTRVRYKFPYLNVRLDYLGDPVLSPGIPKKIRFVVSNTSKAVTSDRVHIYLYAREGCQVVSGPSKAVFLTMGHMGDGMKYVDFEIVAEVEKPIYHFVAEFVYEDNHNNRPMTVPFVLLSDTGETIDVRWEKRGGPATPNLPYI